MVRVYRSGCISALVLAALAVSCGRRPASQAAATTAGPAIEVSARLIARGVTDTVDMGLIRSGESVYRELTVHNADTVPMVITSVKTVCGCTPVDYPTKPIMPDERVSITVGLDTNGLRGWVCKQVGLRTTLSPEARNLVITADVR